MIGFEQNRPKKLRLFLSIFPPQITKPGGHPPGTSNANLPRMESSLPTVSSFSVKSSIESSTTGSGETLQSSERPDKSTSSSRRSRGTPTIHSAIDVSSVNSGAAERSHDTTPPATTTKAADGSHGTAPQITKPSGHPPGTSSANLPRMESSLPTVSSFSVKSSIEPSTTGSGETPQSGERPDKSTSSSRRSRGTPTIHSAIDVSSVNSGAAEGSHRTTPPATTTKAADGSHGTAPLPANSKASKGSHGTTPPATTTKAADGGHGTAPLATNTKASEGSHGTAPPATTTKAAE